MRDGLDCVVQAVAVLPAVTKDLVLLQTADRVLDLLDPREDPAMLLVVGFLARQQRPASRFRR